MARGSFIHEVLEKLLRRLGGPVTAASLPAAETILDELLAHLPDEVAAGQPEAVRAGVLGAIRADLRRYLQHEARDESHWRPQGIELKFGMGSDEDALPAVTLSDGADEVLLRGVIDRLDVDPDGSGRAIVRDYKSGASRRAWQVARWTEDRQLQVALYMIAARRLLGLEPVAGLYQPLGGNDLRPRGLFLRDAPVDRRTLANDGRDPDEFDAILADAEERAVALVRRLRTGELTPCPETCSRDGCRYPGICRSG
jgi:PD-(D/E)XK nuclease superfamily